MFYMSTLPLSLYNLRVSVLFKLKILLKLTCGNDAQNVDYSLVLQSVVEFCKTHEFTHFLEKNLDENTTGRRCVIFI